MRKVLKRLAIVAAIVSSLTMLGAQHASADELCMRAAAHGAEITACVPLV